MYGGQSEREPRKLFKGPAEGAVTVQPVIFASGFVKHALSKRWLPQDHVHGQRAYHMQRQLQAAQSLASYSLVGVGCIETAVSCAMNECMHASCSCSKVSDAHAAGGS